MATPNSPEPRKELASTYIVSDRSSKDEIARLEIQERLLTVSMGGVLPEQATPDNFGRVLDIGCGPGGWLIETAQTYPNLSLLVGIDISEKMLNVARARARMLQLDERVEFHTMDALHMLEFPDSFFGLVNQRAGISWLRRWDWAKLLQEYLRVLHTEGVIRISEVNGAIESNSPALMRLWDLGAQAFYQAGTSFSLTGDNLDSELASLLARFGLQQIQTRSYTLEYRPATAEGQLFCEDIKRLFRTFKPFLQKWTRVPDDYEEIYQQMLQDCVQPDFITTARLFTIWGTKSLSAYEK